MEFEWMIFPGFTTLQILHEIKTFMEALGCNAEQFQGRIIFMSMYNDITLRDLQNEQVCLTNSTHVAKMQRSSLQVIGHFSDQDQKLNGTRQTLSSLEENGTELQGSRCLASSKVDIPYFVRPVQRNEEL